MLKERQARAGVKSEKCMDEVNAVKVKRFSKGIVVFKADHHMQSYKEAQAPKKGKKNILRKQISYILAIH